LDLHGRELRRSGFVVRLQPQSLRVLLCLLERPGEVVSRTDLRLALWGDRTFVSFDRSLNFCLSRLRTALGDDARSPRFIQTVPGRGYRFVAPVRRVRAPENAVATRDERKRPLNGSGRLAAAFALTAGLSMTSSLLPRRLEAPDSVAKALFSEARSLCGTSGWRRSIGLYRAACAREPLFAAAHAGMADAYLRLGEQGTLEAGEAFPAARAAARRALAIEDRADAHLVLGRTSMAFEWDWTSAERELRQSLTLEPGSVTAWVSWARYLSVRGQHDEAVRAAQHAEALDPHADEAIEEAAWCYYRARRFDQAARQFRLVAGRRPEEAHHRLFAIFRLSGRDEEAFREARAVMIRAGVDESQLRLLQRLDPRQAADAYLRGTVAFLRREASVDRVPPERLALLHAALGESSEAIGWLQAAVVERSPGLVTTLVDPALDSLRDDPAFVSLARHVGSTTALGAS